MEKLNKGWGSIRFTLDRYMDMRGISKSQLSKLADMQYTQLLSYCNNTVQRPDLDVLCRICYALNCDLSDIMHYEPPKE